jgi:DmsE family decaheme c-type cytochrome
MTSSTDIGWIASYAHARGHARRRRNAATIALFPLACLLMLAPMRDGAAGEFSARDDSISALREYAEARQIAPAETSSAAPARRFGAPEGAAISDRYMDLRDFAERIGAGGPPVVVAKGEKAKTVVKAEGEATYVGAQVCLGCHAAQAASFGVTLMGKIFRNPRNAQERANCETCHGPGSLHVKAGGGRGVGGIISFRLDDQSHTPDEYNAICLTCHEKGRRILWRGSTHETRGLMCTNCHTIMTNVTPKAQLAKLTEMDTCFQCHKNKRAEIWRTSHMPLREGKMTCSNCHNPHGSYSEALLNEATVNDNCYKCHAEKRGPFLWEHAPVRENCLNCHDPHGSNQDFLLKISRPRLCQQCHATLVGHPGNPRNPKSIYAINRECQNCHSQHHGSNSPAGSRFIR